MFNKNNTFKWLSLLTALLVLGGGSLTAFLLWGTDSPQKQKPSTEQPNEESTPPAYSPAYFSEIIEAEIEALGFAENVVFTCMDDQRFTVSGIFTDLENIMQSHDLLPHDPQATTMYSRQVFTAEGHIGINEKGNGKFILDQVKAAENSLPADIATELIETHTRLNELINVPFESIEMHSEGVVFHGELPLFIRIALYTVPHPSVSGQSEPAIH